MAKKKKLTEKKNKRNLTLGSVTKVKDVQFMGHNWMKRSFIWDERKLGDKIF